ncbi:MAG: hypothetical protein HC840_22435 [Leptolyngbyaceae cyanobacterium RM2_2_4]|nr:hypothetical protein [Leptolyngbyaceae cyanobacterium SM1_4_3]NJO51714.1 hypothetical protein [Leptolyngbyaceae cyanobacterium RM2_2_4]
MKACVWQVSQRKANNHSAQENDQAGTLVDYAGIFVEINATDSAIVPPFAFMQI